MMSMEDSKSNRLEHFPSTSTDWSNSPRSVTEVTDDEDNSVFLRHRLGKSNYTHFHIIVFILTYLTAVVVHGNRKSFGTVKAVLSEEWTPSDDSEERPKEPYELWNSRHFFSSDTDPRCDDFLGILDTAFMLAYAIGLVFFGSMGDRLDMRLVLSFGLFSSSVATILFGPLADWLQFYNTAWYVLLWTLNGFLQATQYPLIVAIMGHWFGKSHRGVIFGIWTTNVSTGNIFGSLLAGALIDFGYDVVMLVPAIVCIAYGIILFFGLIPKPDDVGLPAAGRDEPVVKELSQDEKEPILSETSFSHSAYGSTAVDGEDDFGEEGEGNQKKAIGFFQACMLPGVFIYALAHGFAKMVNYSFFYWLPFYLNREYQWRPSFAAIHSSWYDIGTIVISILAGHLSDKIKRSPVLAILLLASIPFLIIYQLLPPNVALNALVLALTGGCVGGAANLMAGAVTADLGRQPNLSKDTTALSTVSGIIDGAGSFGSAIGQLLIPLLENWQGWSAVFDFFIISSFATFLCILPVLYREMREFSWVQRLCRCCR